MLLLPPVQSKIKDIALSEISKKTGGKIEAGDFRVTFPGNISIKDLYVEDLNGDTLLYAAKLAVKSDLFGLLNNQVRINDVKIDDFVINITRETTESNYNYSFIIDAFAGDESSDSKIPEININRLALTGGNVSYRLLSAPSPLDGTFDANNIVLKDLNILLSAPSLNLETLDVTLQNLSFAERGGLIAKDMRFAVKYAGSSIIIDGFNFKSVNSEIVSGNASFDFSGKYSLNVSSNMTFAADFSCFSSSVENFPEKIAFSLDAEGIFPEINVKSLNIVYGKDCRLSTKVNVKNIFDPLNITADLNVEKFTYNGYPFSGKAEASLVNDSLSVKINSQDDNCLINMDINAMLAGANTKMRVRTEIDRLRIDTLNLMDFPKNTEITCHFDADIAGIDPENMQANINIDSISFKTAKGIINDSNAEISYRSIDGRNKEINMKSAYLNVQGRGVCSFDGAYRSFRRAFPLIFRKRVANPGAATDETLDITLSTSRLNSITEVIGIDTTLPDSVAVGIKYRAENNDAGLQLLATCIDKSQTTANAIVSLTGKSGAMKLEINAGLGSEDLEIGCNVTSSVDIEWIKKKINPNITFNLNGGMITVNGSQFEIAPAKIGVGERRYEVLDFAVINSGEDVLKVNGLISESADDSLLVSLRKIEIGTLLGAMKSTVDVNGTVSGDVSFSRLLTAPRIVTRNFSIDSIRTGNNHIGNLRLTSGWSSARAGFWFRAMMLQENDVQSVVSGFVRPESDSITVNGDIKGLKLGWFSDYFGDNIYGVNGEAGINFKYSGLISSPKFTGTVHLRNIEAGITKTGAMYTINDSIRFTDDRIIFSEFDIVDKYGQKMTVNGNINHEIFNKFNPSLKINLNNFTVIDNAAHRDSLFFGKMQLNGNMTVGIDGNKWLIDGRVSNGRNAILTFNIPQSQIEAKRYNFLSFVQSAGDGIEEKIAHTTTTQTTVSLPIKIKLKVAVNTDLSINALINPATNDIAHATGNGSIDYELDMNRMHQTMNGNYVIENGKCTMTLKNITRKTFTILNGSKLTFRGDLMKTAFDVTAVYSLKANPETLDATFAEQTAYSKIPVDCRLKVVGNLDKINMDYAIILPSESDDVQKKLDNLLSADNIKLKQIAYLLAFGSFAPLTDAGGNTQNNAGIWTSLAASPISTQLNNMLSGVLSDKWSIGAGIHSEDGGLQNVTMDVNISTSLFDDRLTLNSSIGYRNSSAVQTDSENNNLTGDFDLEYKLSPGGNIAVRFFNLTNNRFYEKARTTQGIGIVYKRKGKTFRQLWRSFKTWKPANRRNAAKLDGEIITNPSRDTMQQSPEAPAPDHIQP
ncbi:MAG: translocation/assembly module TamB [Dysgonamonadaceae bacterium]|nr:translocation/assembly module TamB [Dysgonamonadaceae bacterium]